MTPGQTKQLMTVEEVAQYMRCHQSTVYRLLKRRRLPAFRLGSDWRIDFDVLRSWMRGNTISTE